MLAFRVTVNEEEPIYGGFELGAFSVIVSILRETDSNKKWTSYLRLAGEGYRPSVNQGSQVWLNRGFALGDRIKIDLIEAGAASPANRHVQNEDVVEGEGHSSAEFLALEVRLDEETPLYAGFRNGSAGVVASVIDKWNYNPVRRFIQFAVTGTNDLPDDRTEFLTWLKRPLTGGNTIAIKFVEPCVITPPANLSDVFTG